MVSLFLASKTWIEICATGDSKKAQPTFGLSDAIATFTSMGSFFALTLGPSVFFTSGVVRSLFSFKPNCDCFFATSFLALIAVASFSCSFSPLTLALLQSKVPFLFSSCLGFSGGFPPSVLLGLSTTFLAAAGVFSFDEDATEAVVFARVEVPGLVV